MELDLPSPFVTEVFTSTEPVAREAVRKGRKVGARVNLGHGVGLPEESGPRPGHPAD